MGCEGRYAAEFLKYLSDFVANIRPDDPLPVRAPNYKVTESEIDGQILDIVHHYLNSRECPPYVREFVGHQVWTAIRNPEMNGDDMDHVDSANTTNHTYDIMKLIQDVTSKANLVIQELHSTLTIDEVEKLPRYHPISHFAIKNGRRKMEDRHVIIHDLSTLYGLNFKQPHAYYGVFDGHAGIDAAVYSAAHLHQYMIQNPQYETNPEAALKHAFHITDTNFIKKASKEKLKGGTTAVVALVREKRLVVAWLGDSQALLVRRRTPVRMVEPHKPDLPMERDRVEGMGGCVLNIQGTWRVLGQLAVSRAIGDREYKPFVSSECDIKSLEIEGDEDFLILACDGLWDTLSAEAAVNVVYAYLTRNDGDTDGVGRCLVEAARNTGSDDNITAVVVFLRPVATIMEEEAQRIAQGQVPEPVPEAVLCKDSTPSSINAIFSPPINQFDYSTSEIPTYNPFDGDSPHKMDTEEAATPASQHLQVQEEPMEGSEAPNLSASRDSDSDEGIAAQGFKEQAFNPHEAPTPTAEEVDAALAELDSIPDEVCEAGDVEEEDEEEEEWSYYRMDLQTQPQAEDVLLPGSSAPLLDSEVMDQDKVAPTSEDSIQGHPPQEQFHEEEGEAVSSQAIVEHPDISKSPDLFQTTESSVDLNRESNLMETSISNMADYLDSAEAPSSPQAPGSPRSVEGFVTSVELNTPEESLRSNFPTSHMQDINGSRVEQPSGPFSVYVSSSPEPVSLDPLIQASGDSPNVSEMINGQPENEMEPSEADDFSPVEIVHAQSTVEVLASPSPTEMRESEVPDAQTSTVPVDQMSDITFIPKPAVEPSVEVPVPVFIDEGTPVSEGEPEAPGDASTDFNETKEMGSVVLSKEEAEACEAETSFTVEERQSLVFPGMEQLQAPVSAVVEQAPVSPESVSPIFAPVMEQTLDSPGLESPLAQSSPDAEVLKPMESSPLLVSPVAELQAPAYPFEMALPVPLSPAAEPFLAPVSPAAEPSPAPLSPAAEPSPAPLSPAAEPLPAAETSPAPLSTAAETSPAPLSPAAETSPAPLSPAAEPSPAPLSPAAEPSPAPLSPAAEPSPAPLSPAAEPSPAAETSPAPLSPAAETSPAPLSPAAEPSPSPLSPAVEPLVAEVELTQTPASLVTELSPAVSPEFSYVAVSPVSGLTPALPIMEVTSVSPSIVEEVAKSVPTLESTVEQIPPPVFAELKQEVSILDTEEKDEIHINQTTTIIPVVPQEEVKEMKSEVVKSPAKPSKTPAKAVPPGKATPTRTAAGRSTPSRTPLAKTSATKPAEKKPTSLSRPTLKPAPTRPATEKTTTAKTTTSKTTSVTAASKQPTTMSSAKPAPKTTTQKPITTAKPAEKKNPKPATPTAPRSTLSKPSAATSRPTQHPSATKPFTTARTTTAAAAAAAKRPVSAPAKRVEKPDGSKVNGTTVRSAPRTTTTRPATASTVTRKPLSTSTKPVPEKETKNTTNRILSTTAKTAQKATGTARAVTSKTSAIGQSSLTKAAPKVNGTSTTAKSKMASVTRSTTTTTTSKTAGTTAKKTVVSKTSTTKTKTAAAAATATTKVEKSEVIAGPVANGENKIAHEETSVEVIEKCAAEDIVQCSTTEQVISTETMEVIVNGDH